MLSHLLTRKAPEDQMPNAHSASWRIFAPLGIVLLVALAWTAYWFIAIGAAKERLASERLRLSERGFQLSCVQEQWGGFPFRFEFSCTSPKLSRTGLGELASTNLLVMALAYAPWQVVALIDGPSTLLLGHGAPKQAEHDRAVVVLTFESSGLASFSGEVRGIAMPLLGRIEKLSAHTRPSLPPASGTDIAITLNKPVYQPAGMPAMALDQVSILGGFESSPRLAIDTAEIQAGRIKVTGAGTLTLDEQNRVTGELTTETNDIGALIDFSAPYFGLSDEQKANVQGIVGILGNSAKIPIIAKNGLLYLGPFKIADLEPLY